MRRPHGCKPFLHCGTLHVIAPAITRLPYYNRRGAHRAYRPLHTRTMADNNHDWQDFVDHVFTLRRRLGLRRSRATTAIHDALDSFLDPRAYVQALYDIIDVHQPRWEDLEDASLIAQRKMENPHERWRQREIDALRRADASRLNRSNALQRFAMEHNHVSQHVVLHADQITRE